MKTSHYTPEILKLRKAVRALAAYVDGIAWRVASEEEKASIRILEEIKEILEEV